MRLCVYIFIYLHARTHTHSGYVCCMYAYSCIYFYIYTYTCIHPSIDLSIYQSIYLSIYLLIFFFIFSHARTHTHMYIYIYRVLLQLQKRHLSLRGSQVVSASAPSRFSPRAAGRGLGVAARSMALEATRRCCVVLYNFDKVKKENLDMKLNCK